MAAPDMVSVALVIPTQPHDVAVYGPPQGQWTRENWTKLLDDGNRYEIIDGVLYMSTSPSWYHQHLVLRFYDFVGYPAKQQDLAYVSLAPVGLFMPGCDPAQPDFVLVLKDRADIIHDKHIYGVPDLIAEVLSPGTRNFDEGLKRDAYGRCGVPEYAVIDPLTRQLRLYTLSAPGHYPPAQTFNVDDTVTFACLPGISFKVGDLFAGSPDTTL